MCANLNQQKNKNFTMTIIQTLHGTTTHKPQNPTTGFSHDKHYLLWFLPLFLLLQLVPGCQEVSTSRSNHNHIRKQEKSFAEYI